MIVFEPYEFVNQPWMRNIAGNEPFKVFAMIRVSNKKHAAEHPILRDREDEIRKMLIGFEPKRIEMHELDGRKLAEFGRETDYASEIVADYKVFIAY